MFGAARRAATGEKRKERGASELRDAERDALEGSGTTHRALPPAGRQACGQKERRDYSRLSCCNRSSAMRA